MTSSIEVQLTDHERAMLAGEEGRGVARALAIVARMAKVLGANALIEITSAHIDGCLLHGASGVLFAERLLEENGQVRVPTTLNVGALDLCNPRHVRFERNDAALAGRIRTAYESMGCRPSWTCAPYQAGHRPAFGEQVAWGESNAVAFLNSVLGARSNRYGDFLDICCAITGRAPYYGLHCTPERKATVIVDAGGLPPETTAEGSFAATLGAWLGQHCSGQVPAVIGIDRDLSEDELKALGAGAAATGDLGLFHLVGITPEAPTLEAVTAGALPVQLEITTEDLAATREHLSAASHGPISAIALGSPHFSEAEIAELLERLGSRTARVPIYVSTRPELVEALDRRQALRSLERQNVHFLAGTCVVVTPVLPTPCGTPQPVMTNSAKFAVYLPNNTGYPSAFGTLEECIESACAGEILRVGSTTPIRD